MIRKRFWYMKKATIIIIAVILFQGCLLERLEKSRKQLCSEQIKLSTEGSISLVFNRPILYPNDIKKILGKKPSKMYDQANKRYFEEKIAVGQLKDLATSLKLGFLIAFSR